MCCSFNLWIELKEREITLLKDSIESIIQRQNHAIENDLFEEADELEKSANEVREQVGQLVFSNGLTVTRSKSLKLKSTSAASIMTPLKKKRKVSTKKNFIFTSSSLRSLNSRFLTETRSFRITSSKVKEH